MTSTNPSTLADSIRRNADEAQMYEDFFWAFDRYMSDQDDMAGWHAVEQTYQTILETLNFPVRDTEYEPREPRFRVVK